MRLPNLLAGLIAAALAISPASADQATSHDFSVTVGTSATQVLTTFQAGTLCTVYERIWNVAPSGGSTIWLSRSGVAAPNAPGSYPLAPGQFELFQRGSFFPGNALSAISTPASAPLTVECF